MNLNKSFSDNKNLFCVILGLLLITYLYLETPVPINVILNDTLLGLVVLCLIIIAYYLIAHVNVFVGIIFIIIAYEIVRKVNNNRIEDGSLDMSNKKKYHSSTNVKSIISPNLKSDVTLEENIVNSMESHNNQIVNLDDSNYKPILPDLSSTSDL